MLGSISKVYPPPIENIMHCVGRSVNGNGFCQCLFVELICCPHILETDAHTLTLHCVPGEKYMHSKEISIQSSLLLFAKIYPNGHGEF